MIVLLWTTPGLAAAQQAAGTAPPLVLEQVTVVDVEQGKLLPAQRVVIVGTRIQAVGSAAAVPLPKGAQVVAAQGKYVIPGLWDMHVHPMYAAPAWYPLLLANGVTGIRDPGSPVPLAKLRRWREEILAGTRIGPPRQILSGPLITQAGFNGAPSDCVLGERVDGGPKICLLPDSAAIRYVIDSLKRVGTDMLKPYTMEPETFYMFAAEARRRGIPFGGHADQGVGLESGGRGFDGSDSGQIILDHLFGDVLLTCWGSSETITVENCQPYADRLRHNGSWLVPTWRVSFVQENVERLTRCTGTLDGTVPHDNWLKKPACMVPPAGDDSLAMRVIQRTGFPVLAGTDELQFPWVERVLFLAGFSLHAEIASYVAAGLTPLAALQTATLNPAKLLHGTDSLGTVAAGKLADLVLLDADPLADITNTTTIHAVIANGRYFDRAALDQLIVAARAQDNMQLKQEP